MYYGLRERTTLIDQNVNILESKTHFNKYLITLFRVKC